MKNLSDKVLLALVREGNIEVFLKARDELLSRLARGRKAIEFADALIRHRDNGVDLEAEGRIYNWIDEYQQLCKKPWNEGGKDETARHDQ